MIKIDEMATNIGLSIPIDSDNRNKRATAFTIFDNNISFGNLFFQNFYEDLIVRIENDNDQAYKNNASMKNFFMFCDTIEANKLRRCNTNIAEEKRMEYTRKEMILNYRDCDAISFNSSDDSLKARSNILKSKKSFAFMYESDEVWRLSQSLKIFCNHTDGTEIARFEIVLLLLNLNGDYICNLTPAIQFNDEFSITFECETLIVKIKALNIKNFNIYFFRKGNEKVPPPLEENHAKDEEEDSIVSDKKCNIC
ncbi:hypothetical protein TRFO_26151 [Tritrichomonas foetus]|uniref:Uncharacterized protein n=1 Tax=Tritrichomonas foetus TaxID=1144522 RepID=A0A1J4K8A4_9EUKA|nr:hypothetical protein TRFO_26151 [Tritrichomonas foetus]|eukprot:OHT05940.1 hypothetical protein TRFO_26151 [Tritrichomonas foetus]